MKTVTQIFIYAAIFYCLLGCASQGNLYSGEPVREPGKCYAKCLMGDVIEEETFDVPIYEGLYNNQPYIEKQEIILSEASTKWVKRKADKNCLSEDPNDCLVWCLVEIPREVVELLVVTDTSLTKDYEWQSFSKNNTIRKGGHTEWREVLCSNKVTTELNKTIQLALIEKGFYIENLNGTWNTSAKAALVKFQKHNNLPIGSLDIETLETLDIDY